MLGFTAADVINRLTPAYISDPDELVARTESLSREYVDRVKELYPDTLRIVLSGYTDLESIMEAINRGAIYRFYTKPWDNLQLRNNIQEAFSHYRLLHDVPLAAFPGAAPALPPPNPTRF